jgi:5,10-methylenetetrahydromethanopterin reductase
VEVCSRWVSDADALRFAETFCLYGTVEEITKKINDLADLGVTGVQLQHVGSYTYPHELLEALGGVLNLPAGPMSLR